MEDAKLLIGYFDAAAAVPVAAAAAPAPAVVLGPKTATMFDEPQQIRGPSVSVGPCGLTWSRDGIEPGAGNDPGTIAN
jgi:hypothetical protein